jgi:hypothetical protein
MLHIGGSVRCFKKSQSLKEIEIIKQLNGNDATECIETNVPEQSWYRHPAKIVLQQSMFEWLVKMWKTMSGMSDVRWQMSDF